MRRMLCAFFLFCSAPMTDTDDTPIHEPRLWSDERWTARVIKNEDDAVCSAPFSRSAPHP